MAGQLMLLDSPALWYRALYGVPDSIRSPQGEPVNAVRGFLDLVSTPGQGTRVSIVFPPERVLTDGQSVEQQGDSA